MKKIKIRAIKMLFAFVILLSFSGAVVAEDSTRGKDSSGTPSFLMGPSIHFFFGARMKKPPDLDTFQKPIGGIKLSPFGLNFGTTYLSLFVPGIGYIGDLRMAFSLSPFIVSHESGFGMSIDYFPGWKRDDRDGGPYGFSFNLDLIRFFKFVGSFIPK